MLKWAVWSTTSTIPDAMALKYFVVLAVLHFAAVFAEVADIRKCDDVPEDACTITEVRINPCGDNPRGCVLMTGKNASIEFDFTPNFAATKLKTGVYSPIAGKDVAFADMNTNDGCAITTCPTQPGKSQVLANTMYLGKMLPTGSHPLKWKIWNEENDAEICCFQTTVHLKNKRNKKKKHSDV